MDVQEQIKRQHFDCYIDEVADRPRNGRIVLTCGGQDEGGNLCIIDGLESKDDVLAAEERLKNEISANAEVLLSRMAVLDGEEPEPLPL